MRYASRIRKAVPSAFVLLALIHVSAPANAAPCDNVSVASSSPLTAIRVGFGVCSNDATRQCRYAADCVSPGLCTTTNLNRPTYVTALSGDSHRLFVLEQVGRVRIYKDGVLLPNPFLNVISITQSTGDEEGLLGLAFSPTYATDGYFFIYHTDTGGNSNSIERYHISGDPDIADAGSRKTILTIAHPTNSNHNGGCMQFAPDDGYLYIGTGDGGSSCDPPNNAQNTNELKGKILRLDVIPIPAVDPPYRIPVGNPGFPKPEVFAYGIRNPWRFSFDRGNPFVPDPAPGKADFYLGDVGQGNWEEVDFRAAPGKGNGENFGWDHYEGLACPPPACGGSCGPISPRVDPVSVYSHSGGACSITGGYVYRGCRMPDLVAENRYFYADYCAATFSSLVVSGGVATSPKSHTAEFAPLGGFTLSAITTWGEDGTGEMYFTTRGGTNTAQVFHVVPVLRNLEVSGGKATPLLLGSTWSWEDLVLTSGHPIDQYRVYRNIGNGSGTFTCIYKTPPVSPPTRPATTWVGGDPQVPLVGGVFSYLVTGFRSFTPEETSPGRTSAGALRTLSASSCP